MSPEGVGLAGVALMAALLALGCPVGLAMIGVGLGGFALLIGPEPALRILERAALETAGNPGFTVIPLFILMGALVAHAGIGRDLFQAARRLSGGRPVGLALAGLGASAGFAAASGSSLATASAMARAALPEMRSAGTDPRLAAGVIAAGGTLGIMIPPSIALLLYALVMEQSVGAMFLAGVVPGLLGLLLYAIAALAAGHVWQPARLAPQAQETEGGGRGAIAALALFAFVMGGIYTGLFTPTEAAGAGAALALLLALARGLRFGEIRQAFGETVTLSATLFVILIGAEAFGYFLSVSRLAPALEDWVTAAGIGPYGLICAILLFYLLLGCLMDSLAMILLTVPIFAPLAAAAGFDPIWFGILAVTAVEVGLITPPVGLNLFVVRAAATDLPLGTIWRGVLPFVLADILRLALLLALPGLALWLPAQLHY
ncbi:MAG: TRAP transporter large permease subunit [Pseudomonadota bacterium]